MGLSCVRQEIAIRRGERKSCEYLRLDFGSAVCFLADARNSNSRFAIRNFEARCENGRVGRREERPAVNCLPRTELGTTITTHDNPLVTSCQGKKARLVSHIFAF